MTISEDLYVLPADMRASACGALFDTLKVSRGQPMTLDGAAVDRMDSLSAQLFVLAAKTWAQDQQPFKITQASDRIVTTMAQLGLSEHVELEGNSNVD